MMIFNENIEPIIPLKNYKRAQWFDLVTQIKQEQTACCSCCTPTGDAFDVAKAQFGCRIHPRIAQDCHGRD
jgi:hypothetical protein